MNNPNEISVVPTLDDFKKELIFFAIKKELYRLPPLKYRNVINKINNEDTIRKIWELEIFPSHEVGYSLTNEIYFLLCYIGNKFGNTKIINGINNSLKLPGNNNIIFDIESFNKNFCHAWSSLSNGESGKENNKVSTSSSINEQDNKSNLQGKNNSIPVNSPEIILPPTNLQGKNNSIPVDSQEKTLPQKTIVPENILPPTTNTPIKLIPFPVKIKSVLKNAMVNQTYDESIFDGKDSDLSSLQDFSVEIENINSVGGLSYISEKGLLIGKPLNDGNFTLKIIIKNKQNQNIKESDIKFAVIADPRSLWKENEPTDEEKSVYDKEHTRTEKILLPSTKKIIAASKRGRSHALNGAFRDDDFEIKYLDSGWSIIAVGDGAGSAKLSRIASTKVCQISINEIENSCKDLLSEIDSEIISNNENRIKEILFKILAETVKKGYKYIQDNLLPDYTNKVKGNLSIDHFATTILLAIHKRFEDIKKDFFASIWIGDGGIGIYVNEQIVENMGKPDSGSFGGETRFITTSSVIKDDSELAKRLEYRMVDSFKGFFVMTDGISDPKFETDNNLEDPRYWKDLWKELTEPDKNDSNSSDYKSISESDEPEKELLKWMYFWSQGNHDDRTLALLF